MPDTTPTSEDLARISTNDTLPLEAVAPGGLWVKLFGVSRNCAVGGQNPRVIQVVAGDTAEVSFQVTCVVPPPLVPLHNQIVFVSGRDFGRDIHVMGADGSNPVDLTNTPFVAKASPAVSHDGRKIAFAESYGYLGLAKRLHVMDADGFNQTLVLDDDWVEGPSWSPDGQKIAFGGRVIQDISISYIGIVNVDGTGVLKLSNNGSHPAWSPDGTKLAFIRSAGGSDNIYVMGVDGSNPVRLTNTSSTDMGGLQWSPDGTRLAYATRSHLTVMNADGSNAVALQSDLCDSYSISSSLDWSPDGTKLVFGCGAVGDASNMEIVVMSLDGAWSAVLSSHPAYDGDPGWAK